MTCPPNAFRSGEGLIRLEPGRSFTSSWGIDPRATSAAMIDIDSESFLAVVIAGALAAFLAGLVSTRMPLPVVVLEILLGILIGPDVLGFADPDEFLDFFSNLGLGMLFFFAGYEIDFERIRGSPSGLPSWAGCCRSSWPIRSAGCSR